MTSEEIRTVVKDAVREGIEAHHQCIFSEEERVMVRDLISVGQQVKRTILWSISLAILGAIGYISWPGSK